MKLLNIVKLVKEGVKGKIFPESKKGYEPLPKTGHPWEDGIPGRFTPVYRVDKRVSGLCTGKPIPSEEDLQKAYWNNIGDKYED